MKLDYVNMTVALILVLLLNLDIYTFSWQIWTGVPTVTQIPSLATPIGSASLVYATF